MASLYDTDFYAWTRDRSEQRLGADRSTKARGSPLPVAALVALFALAACDAPPRAPVAGVEGRAKVDAATKAWSDCLDATVKQLATSETQAADAAAGAFTACAPKRAALVDEIRRFHRLGAPTETATYNAAVAEASVAGIEGDLRSQTEITAVSWKLDHDKVN